MEEKVQEMEGGREGGKEKGREGGRDHGRLMEGKVQEMEERELEAEGGRKNNQDILYHMSIHHSSVAV